MIPLVDARISIPAGIVVSGASQSGKTIFTLNLLKNLNRLLNKPIRQIFWFYGVHTRTIDMLDSEFHNSVTTVEGLPESFQNYIPEDGYHNMLIFDDLLRETAESKLLVDLTSRQSSHNNITWVLLLQDLFYRGKERLTILRNAHYIIQFKNPLNNTIVNLLATRILPQDRKSFMDIFRRATSKPHGYLFIDGTQQSSELMRFRTDIFGEFQTVFVPKSVLKSIGLKLPI